MDALQRTVTKCMKSYGFFLRTDACAFLVENASRFDDDERMAWLDSVAQTLTAQQVNQTVLDRAVVERAASVLPGAATMVTTHFAPLGAPRGAAADVTGRARVEVIDAFDVPKYTYLPDRKHFIPSRAPPVLHSPHAESKAAMYRERLTILRHRTLRDPMFAPRVAAAGADRSVHFSLTTLDAVLSGSIRRPRQRHRGYESDGSSSDGGAMDDDDAAPVIVAGVLTQFEQGRWYLEDADAHVPLDLTHAEFHHGLFAENCVVLAEGSFDDGLFTVRTLLFPPPESRAASLMQLGDAHLFGGARVTPSEAPALAALERTLTGDMVVVLSDVWLDHPRVLAKLRLLFEGFAAVEPPPVFVLMGDFTSEGRGADRFRALKEGLDALADAIVELGVQRSPFIFVPGPRDPGVAGILPRPPLPAACTARLQSRVKGAVFASNPARVRLYSQELVFFREDTVTKLRRHCVRLPGGSDLDISEHAVRTIVDQAHLAPVPLHATPLYWEHEHAMRLLPLPDVLVLADRNDAYTCAYKGCTVFNPGSLLPSDFGFMVYYPARLRSEDPDEQRACAEPSKIE